MVMRRMTREHRAARIETKTRLAEHLTKTSMRLREDLKAYMSEHRLSAEQSGAADVSVEGPCSSPCSLLSSLFSSLYRMVRAHALHVVPG